MFAIPVSTLRYYDKEGLFSNLKRAGKFVLPCQRLRCLGSAVGLCLLNATSI